MILDRGVPSWITRGDREAVEAAPEPRGGEADRGGPEAPLGDHGRSLSPGCCRPCYVERFGEREARDLEEVWSKKREGTEGA